MPRSGWVALGAIIAALTVASVDGRRSAAAFGLTAAAAVLAGWTLAGTAGLDQPPARGARLVRVATLVALGGLIVAARLVLVPLVGPSSMSDSLPGGRGPWTGSIVSIAPSREGRQPVVMQLDAPAAFRVAVTLPPYPAVVPGDRISVTGTLRAPPVDDPYGAYLARNGVAATLRASAIIREAPPGNAGPTLERLRRGADEALGRALPEPEAGLASGILIGLRDRVDRELTAAFTAVGATHVVAISGWNIAIVASTLAALAGPVARRRRVLLTALAIAAYVAFVGPSPSVVRAAGMAGVVLLARELGRPSRAAAAIGLAVTGLLVADPHLVDDVGFRLSALATVGLIAWGTPLAERLAGRAPGRARAWLAESLGVSLAAQLATLPAVVLTFGRLSIVSPVINLGVVPLVAPAMAAGALALGGGLLSLLGLPGAVATVLSLPAWVLFSVIVWLVRTGASLPFASLGLAAPWDALVAGLAAALMVAGAIWVRRAANRSHHPTTAARSRTAPTRSSTSHPARARPPWWRSRVGRGLAGAMAAAVMWAVIVVVHRPDGVPRIIVLDVGQGDAILVEGGRGGRLLVDGGPDPGRLLVGLDERLPPWDRRIDVAVLTHPHEDHAAGLATLLARYDVAQVLEPGMIGPGPGYAALNGALVDLGIPRGTLATGDLLTVDDVRFRVLWPDADAVPERPSNGGTAVNNVSIVLLGEVGRHRVLLAGDIEEGIDPVLLARGIPPVDLLKVAHHGSRTSSTEQFLAAVRPGVAVISAGRDNPYGHPAPETVQRVEATGAHVYRTDRDGTVTVDLGPGSLRVHRSGSRAAAAWPRVASGVPRSITASALLCGIASGEQRAASTVEFARPAAAAATTATTLATPSRVRARVAPADAPPLLRYDACRDLTDPAGARRLLLGRRRLRDRGGRRSVPARPGPLPVRRSGAMAHPGRGGRGHPTPGGARRPARDGHDVRGRDAGDPDQCRPVGAEGRGS